MAILLVFQVLPEMGLRPIILANKASKVDVESIFVLRTLLALISTFIIFCIVQDLLIIELVGVSVYLFSRPYLDFLHFSDASENTRPTIQYTAVVVLATNVIKIYFALEWQGMFWAYLGFEGLFTIAWSYYNGFYYRQRLNIPLGKAVKYIPLIFSSFIVALTNRLDVIYVQYVAESSVATFNYSVMLSTGLYFILTAFFLVDLNKVNIDNIYKIEPSVMTVLTVLVFIPTIVHIIHTSYFTKEFKGNIIFTSLYSANILLQLPLMRLSHILIKELGPKFVLYKDMTFLFMCILTNVLFYALFGLPGVVTGTLISSLVNLLIWNYVLKLRR